MRNFIFVKKFYFVLIFSSCALISANGVLGQGSLSKFSKAAIGAQKNIPLGDIPPLNGKSLGVGHPLEEVAKMTQNAAYAMMGAAAGLAKAAGVGVKIIATVAQAVMSTETEVHIKEVVEMVEKMFSYLGGTAKKYPKSAQSAAVFAAGIVSNIFLWRAVYKKNKSLAVALQQVAKNGGEGFSLDDDPFADLNLEKIENCSDGKNLTTCVKKIVQHMVLNKIDKLDNIPNPKARENAEGIIGLALDSVKIENIKELEHLRTFLERKDAINAIVGILNISQIIAIICELNKDQI